jgi:hypothetical protein
MTDLIPISLGMRPFPFSLSMLPLLLPFAWRKDAHGSCLLAPIRPKAFMVNHLLNPLQQHWLTRRAQTYGSHQARRVDPNGYGIGMPGSKLSFDI